MKIPYSELLNTFETKLLAKGFAADAAAECARLFAEATLDGVNSHGVNRFVLFCNNIDKGLINVHARPVKVKAFNALEQWDGQQGSGLNNASFAMRRAMALADEFGMACVAMRNTNHWMRGGSYGLIAAQAGYMSICWSNTMPNMPVWGGDAPRIGNNPLIFSLPAKPNPVLLDMSMSLYSYGKMDTCMRKGEQLPYPGGFNTDGELTSDPQSILDSWLPLSIGYWKGSGLSIMLDLFASILSQGNSTADIGKIKEETALSQVFICIKPEKILPDGALQAMASEMLNYISSSTPLNEGADIRYPGQRGFQFRERQLEHGVEVDDAIWQAILALTF